MGPVHSEGQKFQDEEEVGQGEDGAETGGCCFCEKAPGASFFTAALADFLTDFLTALHFSLASWAACCKSFLISWPKCKAL
jgi:hypothetical protein